MLRELFRTNVLEPSHVPDECVSGHGFPVDVREELGTDNYIHLVYQERGTVDCDGLMGAMFVTAGHNEVVEVVKRNFVSARFGVFVRY